MKIKTIILILFIFLLPSILANENCFQEACAGLRLSGGNGYTAFGSNLVNVVSNVSNYNSCMIESSKYTIIATDTDGDASSDIFSIVNGIITLYDTNCNQIRQLTLSSDIRAMPVLVETYETGKGIDELVILRNETLELYEININGSALVRNISYASTGEINLDYLSCTRETDICLGFKAGQKNVTVFNLTAETVTLLPNESTREMENVRSTTRSGLSTTVVTQPVFLNCLMFDPTGFNLRCDTYLDTGQNVVVASFGDVISGQTPTGIIRQDAFIARVNGIDRILVSGYASSISGIHYMKASTMAGVVLIGEEGTGSTTANYSNWVVVDFDKDGDSDACILRQREGVGDSVLRCYDATFTSNTTYILRNSTHGFMNWTYGVAIADFNGSASTMGIATVEGIFYPDADTPSNASGTTALMLTGYSAPGNDRAGNIITIMSDSGSGSPAYVYTDSSLGFVVRNTNIAEACGDGICQIWENQQSCYEDCHEGVEGTCLFDDDCPDAFPVCFNKRCVRIDGANQTCVFNTDCPFNNPICWNGLCVNGIQGELPPDAGTSDPGGIDGSVDFFLDSLLGTSPVLRFIIGIAIVLALMVAMAQAVNNAVIIAMAGLLGMIMMTVLNMIPIYVLLLFIIGGLGILVFKFIILDRSGGGG